MAEVGSAREFRRQQTRVFALWAVAIVVVGGGLLYSCNRSASTSREGLAACSHFRAVADDQQRGILTDSQLLAKMQEVAQDAPGGPIAVAADQAVQGLIAGDDSQAAAGVLALNDACTNAGH